MNFSSRTIFSGRLVYKEKKNFHRHRQQQQQQVIFSEFSVLCSVLTRQIFFFSSFAALKETLYKSGQSNTVTVVFFPHWGAANIEHSIAFLLVAHKR
jgi:hypothetical protein